MRQRSDTRASRGLLPRAGGAGAGYTLIEVMMSLTVLAIGAAGIFALQTVAVRGNADAADLTAATNIGREWIARLETDATAWGGPNPPNDFSNTFYLNGVALGDGFVALAPPPEANPVVAPTPQRRDGTFDAVSGEFCAQARFRRPVLAPGVPAIDAIEVTVRIWWFKGTFHDRAVYPACGQGVEDAMDDRPEPGMTRFHWVYLTTLLTPQPPP